MDENEEEDDDNEDDDDDDDDEEEEDADDETGLEYLQRENLQVITFVFSWGTCGIDFMGLSKIFCSIGKKAIFCQYYHDNASGSGSPGLEVESP